MLLSLIMVFSLTQLSVRVPESNSSSVSMHGRRTVIPYRACSESETINPPCLIGSELYRCTPVPGSAVLGPGQESPDPICQSANFSLGTFKWCASGEWLCACSFDEIHEQPSWKLQCPSVLPKIVDFQGYRLGNIIDKWWSYRVNFGGPLHSKYAKEFQEIKQAGCPHNSFGDFLWQFRNRNLKGPKKDLWGTDYEDIAMAFWVYNFDAIAFILPAIRAELKEAIRQYVKESGFTMPTFAPHTCVVHYRIGDFLSVGVLDPLSMADALKEWVVQHGLKVVRFHVLASGAVAHSLNPSQARKSASILEVFTSRLSQYFDEVAIHIDNQGSPDDDWFKMVTAPMLFTSHGSYAVSAALVSDGIRASPATEWLDSPDCMSRAANLSYAPGWSLYSCLNGFNASDRVVVMPEIGQMLSEVSDKHQVVAETLGLPGWADTSNFDVQPRCYVQGTEYVCAVVEYFMVTSTRQPSPHPRCLGGKHSWGICKAGKFLCRWPDGVRSGQGARVLKNRTRSAADMGIIPMGDGCFVDGLWYSCQTSEVVRSLFSSTKAKKKCLDAKDSGGLCETGSLLCALNHRKR